MSDVLDGPADTRMMGIVHSALRRDLERSRIVLTAGTVPDARRAALAEHLIWMMDFLHHHHEGEDNGLYPLVRAKDAALGEILDSMNSEHEAIVPAMDEVKTAARSWAKDPTQTPRVLAAIEALNDVLAPHLKHEEEEMMPLVQQAVSQREWQEWDQATNVGPKSSKQLAFEGHWLIDNTTAEERNTVVHQVPAVPRFFLLNFMGGPYRKRRAALWDGTPAVGVPSLTLAAVPKGN
jgi:hemerythrin HHE cation binding domain-containing protein